jgi:deoxyribonuclease-4
MKIGRHINVSQGFLTAPAYAKSIGCNIFQIFLGVPQFIISKAVPVDDLKKFGDLLKKLKLLMVIHGSYTINLCHPKKNNLYKSSVRSLVQDLKASSIIGNQCLGVIIHMGKNIPALGLSNNQALENYVYGLKEALMQTPQNTTIILETGAGQGNEIGSNINDLAQIYWYLNEKERERIKFCIDTCHIFSYGYNISTLQGVNEFFKLFNDLIGSEKIACIHFNDSETKLNSMVDRHADLGYGFVGDNGLKAVAQFAEKNGIPLIMETPLDAINVKTNQEVTFEEEFSKVKSWLK